MYLPAIVIIWAWLQYSHFLTASIHQSRPDRYWLNKLFLQNISPDTTHDYCLHWDCVYWGIFSHGKFWLSLQMRDKGRWAKQVSPHHYQSITLSICLHTSHLSLPDWVKLSPHITCYHHCCLVSNRTMMFLCSWYVCSRLNSYIAFLAW